MGSDSDDKSKTPEHTKSLTEQIEVFYQEPIPQELAEHLEHFFKELNFGEYPIFDLTDVEQAKKASLHAEETLKVLKQKMTQIKALQNALTTAKAR
jgi:hypothetical protein